MNLLRHTPCAIGVLLAALAVPGSAAAQATYSYQWADTTGAAISGSYQAAAGSTFTLQVYVVESGGTVLTTDGLFSAGVRARYYDSAVTGTTANVLSVASTSAISPNTAFTDASAYVPTVSNPNYAQFTEATTSPTAGVKAVDNRVLLGSLTFTVTGSIGQSTILSAIDIPGTSDTVTASPSFSILDSSLAAHPANLTFNVVPEPSLVLLAGGVALAGGRLAARRRGRAS